MPSPQSTLIKAIAELTAAHLLASFASFALILAQQWYTTASYVAHKKRHRLGVPLGLRQSLSSTNLIESCLSTVRHVTRNVKRWRGGAHIARWTVAGLLEAERKFRRVKGYRRLVELTRKLNPELHCQAQVA